MLPSKTCTLIIVSTILSFLLNGCGGTYSGPSSGRVQESVPASRETGLEPASQPPPREEPAQENGGPAQTPAIVTPTGGGAAAPEVKIDAADREFVQRRLDAYGNKYQSWLEISEMAQEGTLAEEITAVETECLQRLERIMSGYSLLLQRLQQSDTVPADELAALGPEKIQQLDIAFLESRCSDLLTTKISDRDALQTGAEAKLSFDTAQEVIASQVEQGHYQEALASYERLTLDFPDKKLSPATELNYGLALRYTGQLEAAARHFKDLLDSGGPPFEPLRLQRQIADLFLASGDIPAAESSYDSVISGYGSLGAEKAWAEEQLAFLRSADPDSEDMAAYMKLLQEFQTFDYRVEAPRLNEAVHAFASQHAGSPAAVSALRLKTFAQEQMQSWFDRQLIRIDSLVAQKKYPEAIEILKSMTRYYLPPELQALLQKTYYEVAQTEIQEMDAQRRQREMELAEQWENATKLLNSQQYDAAIAAFTALLGTEYDEQAKSKIAEAANEAADQMHKKAAFLFLRAGKTQDPGQKRELLRASHRMLTEILAKYPQSDLQGKVQQNISIMELQIQRFDPELLKELQQEDQPALPIEPPAQEPRQLP